MAPPWLGTWMLDRGRMRRDITELPSEDVEVVDCDCPVLTDAWRMRIASFGVLHGGGGVFPVVSDVSYCMVLCREKTPACRFPLSSKLSLTCPVPTFFTSTFFRKS